MKLTKEKVMIPRAQRLIKRIDKRKEKTNQEDKLPPRTKSGWQPKVR